MAGNGFSVRQLSVFRMICAATSKEVVARAMGFLQEAERSLLIPYANNKKSQLAGGDLSAWRCIW